MNYRSETEKYRHLTKRYCYVDVLEVPGCGLDIASQGDPVVPWAWQLDLPAGEFSTYNNGNPAQGPIQLRGHADRLPVEDRCLDFVYASHILEDFPEDQWPMIFAEWARPLKPGGYLIILIPDRALWVAACEAGQTPNDAHRREGEVGLMTRFALAAGLIVITDSLTNCFPGDYSILGVFRKPSQ